jgi:hypothetical protein
MNQHALTKAQPKPSLVPTALKIEKKLCPGKVPPRGEPVGNSV